jgi:hypothetical protein
LVSFGLLVAYFHKLMMGQGKLKAANPANASKALSSTAAD